MLRESGRSTTRDRNYRSPTSRDQILDEQEDVIEEVLLCIAVYVRVLSGIFPKKLSKAKVNVYDYDGSRIDNIELSEIANLLLHQRYILIRKRVRGGSDH